MPLLLTLVHSSLKLIFIFQRIWSTAEDDAVRLLAFLLLLRLFRQQQEQQANNKSNKDNKNTLDNFLRHLYTEFIRNCKFTSSLTWGKINFMKRSLVQIFGMEKEMAYKLGFLFVRQLAVHVRNAIVLKKKVC